MRATTAASSCCGSQDTDLHRSTEAAEQVILDIMQWLGLDYDEGPIPQTTRFARYRVVIEDMRACGLAYRCYATREEIEVLREEQRTRGEKLPPAGICA